jgi:transcriptional regulator of acetoin/glycerol metabolism
VAPVERPDFESMVPGSLNVARERNQRLVTHAAPVMAMLFDRIANTESVTVLTDAEGIDAVLEPETKQAA